MKEFNIDLAIEYHGSCKKQKVVCSECKMGIYIYEINLKDDLEDMCQHQLVYYFSMAIKRFM